MRSEEPADSRIFHPRSNTALSTLSTPMGAGTGGATVETRTASSTPPSRANRWEVRPDNSVRMRVINISLSNRGGQDGGESCWDIYVLKIHLTLSELKDKPLVIYYNLSVIVVQTPDLLAFEITLRLLGNLNL